jgi:hypothetical protein
LDLTQAVNIVLLLKMKTTFDLPPQLLQRGKIAAAQRRTSLKSIVIEGLEVVLGEENHPNDRAQAALARLQQGYDLGNQPLTRSAAHERP